MHISQIKESRFLKKEDVGREGVVVTIRHITQENVAKQNEEQDLQWALHFEELEKPMVLKPTNANMISAILGEEETDNWAGKQICIFEDPTIMFGGKLVGGIRVKDARNASGAQRFDPPQQQPAQRSAFRQPAQPQQPYSGYVPKAAPQQRAKAWPSSPPPPDDDGRPDPDDDNLPI